MEQNLILPVFPRISRGSSFRDVWSADMAIFHKPPILICWRPFLFLETPRDTSIQESGTDEDSMLRVRTEIIQIPEEKVRNAISQINTLKTMDIIWLIQFSKTKFLFT